MRILIAHDEAFNFTYRANIDSLREMGEVSFFSPLHDQSLPPCDLMYLPGGYPELHLDELKRNSHMARLVADYAEGGGKVYAECGGFMYLCRDIDGTPMCGVLPLRATMSGARLHLGYRQMTINGETMLRGHEFHYSSIIDGLPETSPNASLNLSEGGLRKCLCQRSAKGAATDTAIYLYKNVIAGYTHWYWAETGFIFFQPSFRRNCLGQ